MILEKNAVLSCPVCAGSLLEQEKSYVCSNKHTFDKAKQGYVNLSLSNQKKTLEPADYKETLKERLTFLKKDYFQTIVQALNKAVAQHTQDRNTESLQIADLACDVGYYLSCLKNHLDLTSPLFNYWGIDNSKEAIHGACLNDKEMIWAISGPKKLPFNSHSIDILLSIFSSLNQDEAKRVLSPNGLIFAVTPARHHLQELRRLIFDEVKELDAEKVLEKSNGIFELISSIPVQSTIELQSSQDIENLLKMTPFYSRSSAVKKMCLRSLETLTVTIDVTIWIFKQK